jgi:RNA polymerase sigma factor (TIGR02999 family)
MEPGTNQDVTRLLQKWSEGDRASMDRLIELVYPEMQRIALRYLQHERVDHTLQSTALVHEAYLRLVQQSEKQWANRAHFFAVASRIIRGILVDYARARLAIKRGAGAAQIALSDAVIGQDPGEVDLLDLDNALESLARLDPQQSQIVEMRFFGGLSIEETAEVLKISPSTVKRDWIMAKTWIRRRLGQPPSAETPAE